MTQKTAKEIFDALIFQLRKVGLTDVGTFLISNDYRNNQYNKSDNEKDYKYTDTETALAELEISAGNSDNALFSLKNLINATLEYMMLASSIPDSFNTNLRKLNIEDNKLNISIETINEKAIYLNEILSNNHVNEFIDLLLSILENLELEDDVFFARIS